MIDVYFVCRDEKEAVRISEALVKEKLAACCNIIKDVRSIYFWEGKICDDKECVVFAKTTRKKSKECEKKIKSLHSYKVPCILFLNVKASKEYERWAKKQTT